MELVEEERERERKNGIMMRQKVSGTWGKVDGMISIDVKE
jgi:hypothetical protein